MTSATLDRPFRSRALAAILIRLSERPAALPVGEAVVDWCRVEDIPLDAGTPTSVARERVQQAYFELLPSLKLA